MDYINKYNLCIDVKHQKISIEYQNRLFSLSIDSDKKRYSQTKTEHVSRVQNGNNTTRDSTVIRTITPVYTVVLAAEFEKQNICDNVDSMLITAIAKPSEYIQNLTKLISNTTFRTALSSLLSKFSQIFDISKHNIAKTSIPHVINTIPHSPPASKPYHQPDKEKPMYDLIQEFLEAGLISESNSPYAAPSFLVSKKDGSYRFVVDYRKLNLITIKDSSPLPNMEDTLRKLGEGYKFFSKLDLKSGFYQIPIREMDKEKTAFVTSFGLYQFNVLPMGLKNSPPTFQKVMMDTLKECRTFALVYLDDIIVFSKSFEKHLSHLEQVLHALQSKNLVLNPPKCIFAQEEIDYLGHTVSQNKIIPLRERIQAIEKVKEPKTLTQANKFIGGLSWYRKFIPHFASIAAPIHSVTNLTKENKHKFKWQSSQSKAFHQLKEMLTSKPLFLHYPVDNVPLILSTDASDIGIGGILQQEIDGEIHNLYYHSQLMTACERKYSVIEKEALAIYKCLTRMRTFLLGRSIILRTDHCPLCHIMEKTVRNARVDRIACLIQEFNIEKVIHIKGRENCFPDFLSRYFNDTDDLFEIEYGLRSNEPSAIPPSNKELVNAMMLRSHVKQKKDEDSNLLENEKEFDSKSDSYPISEPQSESNPKNFSCSQFNPNKLIEAQHNDATIEEIKQKILNCDTDLPYVFENNIVYRLISVSLKSKRKIKVIYLPSSMIQPLLQASHDDPMTGAHFSVDRTYHKLKSIYWWPRMKLHIKSYIDSCIPCKQYNISRHKPYGFLHPTSPPEGPFQIIGIDYCGPFARTPRENQYVLVITDHFTRYVTAIALPSCTAEMTARTIFNEYFCKFGIPSVILSDQGTHFQNQLMANIQILIGYTHIYSTTYHPQTNGIVERFNATFVPQLAKLHDSQHNNWDEYLQAVVFAYNTGVHKSTKYSPYELLYGRTARLPIHTRPQYFSFTKPNDYFDQLRKTLRIYHQTARNHIVVQQQHNKQNYDSNRKDPQYNLGDIVLTRIHGLRGKLEPKFSPIPRVITKVNHPTYEVFDEEKQTVYRVHVADLKPILIA